MLRRKSSLSIELPVKELRFSVPSGEGDKATLALSAAGEAARKLKALAAPLLLLLPSVLVGVAGVQDSGLTKK